jgi:hypothetical protein
MDADLEELGGVAFGIRPQPSPQVKRSLVGWPRGDAATMTEQPGLFPEPKRAQKKRGTAAPESLTTPQRRDLEDWAERVVPWLSREALDSFENLESYTEEILEWWRGEGGLKVNWVATIQNRIRTAERRRLADMARHGSEGARLALRSAESWKRTHDARAVAAKAAAEESAPEYLNPGGGGEVYHLGDLRGDRRR